MSSFTTYLIGFVILIIGLALGAYLLNVPPAWIGVGVIILLGIGVLSATGRTRTRDLPSTTQTPPTYPPTYPPPTGGSAPPDPRLHEPPRPHRHDDPSTARRDPPLG